MAAEPAAQVGAEDTESPARSPAVTGTDDLAMTLDNTWGAAERVENGLRRLLLKTSGVGTLVEDPAAHHLVTDSLDLPARRPQSLLSYATRTRTAESAGALTRLV